jgi:nitrogen regulatory protein PII-like uncharacterized protein
MDVIFNELPDEQNIGMWIYDNNLIAFNKYNQFKISSDINKTYKYSSKISPLELILECTSVSKIMKKEVKEKIINFISEPEFSKAFGNKRSADIISAITRDTWNQPTALFISFLLDSNIIYKEKSYLYNKDKNKQEIIIVK